MKSKFFTIYFNSMTSIITTRTTDYYKDVLGRTAKCDLKRGTPLTFDVVDGMEAFEP